VETQMYALLEEAEQLRGKLKEAIQKDANAFGAVMEAFRLPRDTDEEATARQKAIDEATLVAAQVPLDTARMAVRVMQLAAQTTAIGNSNAISDGATGVALGRAALTGAGYNVRINVASLSEPSRGAELVTAMKKLEAQADEIEAQARDNMVERGGISLP
jgi:formiminotetrahydrofolate cyclodeaminase